MNALPNDKPRVILMADDDEDDRMLTGEAIERAGLGGTIRFFADGAALMDHLTCDPGDLGSNSNDNEIILLDINMPRKDGWAVLEELKSNARLRSIPVIFLTTSSNPDDVARGYRMGVNSYVTKPRRFDELVRLVGDIGQYWFETVRLPGHVND